MDGTDELADERRAHRAQRTAVLGRSVVLAGEGAEAGERPLRVGEHARERVGQLLGGVARLLEGEASDRAGRRRPDRVTGAGAGTLGGGGELAASLAPRDQLRADPLTGRGRLGQQRQRDRTGEGEVLDVVHGVGDVVGPVHHLRLDAALEPPLLRHAITHPLGLVRSLG
jgi:hypothetical protein